jgi:hypothetical protein
MSSNKYVPPALRNRKDEKRVVELKDTAENFPTLGSASVRAPSPWTKKSFAVLAAECDAHSKEEKERLEFEAARRRREEERKRFDEQHLVRMYRPVHENDVHEECLAEEDEKMDDGWTTIERKAKREFTLEELHAREAAREAEETNEAELQKSVWNEHAANDWDYRDRRTYS